MSILQLYHTGFLEIREPDVRHGRVNADFGQGFYLSPDRAFSERWAKSRRGSQTVVNAYELELDGLDVRRLSRDGAWFDYIYRNRTRLGDALIDADVIIGPIANDTIYDTWGVITSGLIPREQALALLTIGPEYRQVVIKTEKAAEALRWQSARVLDPDEIARCQATVKREEEAYQALFIETYERISRDG